MVIFFLLTSFKGETVLQVGLKASLRSITQKYLLEGVSFALFLPCAPIQTTGGLTQNLYNSLASKPFSPNVRESPLYVIKKWEPGTHFHEQKQAIMDTSKIF